MGYTHYYRTSQKVSTAKWNKLTEATNKILDGQSILQQEFNNPVAPVVNDKEIRFNGIEDDGHETFLLMKTNSHSDWADKSEKLVFNFCKTARKPYDEYVTAILLVAIDILGDDIQVSSDGYIDEWKEGVELVKAKLGIEYKIEENSEGHFKVVTQGEPSLKKAVDGLAELPKLKDLTEQN